MAGRVRASRGKSALGLVWCTWVFWKWRYNCFICHVTSYEYLIEGPYDVMGGNSSRYVTTLKSLVIIDIMVVEICFEFVTSREHMFKGLCEFMGGSPTQWITALPCLVVIVLVQVEIYKDFHNSNFIHGGRALYKAVKDKFWMKTSFPAQIIKLYLLRPKENV